MTCIFCDIALRRSPAHIIWEDQRHLAFLSIFPNTPGFPVVIPKLHCTSYAFVQNDKVICDLIIASKRTALLLDRSLAGVARTGLILEGYGVDHLHTKLFPMHGTGSDSAFKPISSNIDKFFNRYEGYISSHDAGRADDSALAKLAARIRSFDA